MNASTEFEKALKYVDLSLSKLAHEGLIKQAKINRSIALAGLGRTLEASEFAADNGINLDADYLLNEETGRDALYLGFLLAKAKDPKLATALYNRQLDITAQKFLENNSRDTTAMLADMISHELRTPLNGIIGISDFLANYHEDPAIRKKTGIILESGNELLSVIESLTDMARLDAGQLELAPHDADLSQSLTHLPENWTKMAICISRLR